MKGLPGNPPRSFADVRRALDALNRDKADELIEDFIGTGTPEGVVTATRGSTYRRIDGGAGTCFYVKESDAGNTGWAAK